jgi:hypothetical protein
MTQIEKPESVMRTLTGKSENLSFDADKIYTGKVTAPRLSSQTLELLEKSREFIANRPKKNFPAWVMKELTHKVFAKLLDLLTLTEKTKKTLIQHGFSEIQIEQLNFRSCPSEIENRLICYELNNKFGDLSVFPGFVRMRSAAFRLNLSPHLEHSGIILPKRDKLTQRFYCLHIFRSIEDSYSFILRSNPFQGRANNEY